MSGEITVKLGRFILPPLPTPTERPKVIHKQCCPNCPSAPGREPTPDTQDFLEAPRAIQIESCFPCGWRPDKLCKGYCDTMRVTEGDL